MVETILQNWIFTKFLFPFLLIFFVVFAILEKTKVFGSEKKQINALVALVIGLIFVGVAYPVDVVNNLILFLTVSLIVVFIVLLLWGFATGSTDVKIEGNMKKFAAFLIGVAVVVAVLWITGIQDELYNGFVNIFFKQAWSKTFWTNAIFVIAIAAAIAVIWKTGKKKD